MIRALRPASHGPAFGRTGSMLALLALLLITFVTGWHAAHVHVHDTHHEAAVAGIDNDHVGALPDQDDEPDGLFHSVAHAVLQGLDVPAAWPVAVATVEPVLVWEVVRQAREPSHAPGSLLRPPRS